MNNFHFMINNDISLMEYFKLNPSNFKFYFLTQIHIYLQFSQKAPFVSSYRTNNTQFAIHTNLTCFTTPYQQRINFLPTRVHKHIRWAWGLCK